MFFNMLKLISKNIDDKVVYFPVCTETIAERFQWNRWFILGWHVYLIIILNLLVHTYIILYMFI